jgi:S-phase kinase-associated protein 1
MSITLTTNDKVSLEVDKKTVCKFSETLNDLLMDVDVDNVPIYNVNSLCMGYIIEYINHHKEPSEECTSLKDNWNIEFRHKIAEYVIPEQTRPYTFLADMILAANYLNIKTLLDFLSKVYAEMINGLTSDEIREKFGITEKMTAEEEEKIRKDNEWCNNA